MAEDRGVVAGLDRRRLELGVSVGGGRKLLEVLTAGSVGDEDFVVTARIGGSGG